MPVRLLRQYLGQAAGTTYYGTDEEVLRATQTADDQLNQASDYIPGTRLITIATANTNRSALVYWLNSASAQTITVMPSGYHPVGTVQTFVQKGSGAFTLAPATGVTFSTALTSYISKGINNIAQIIKDGPNSWTVFGGVGG